MLRRSLRKLAPPTLWRVLKCWRPSRIWHSAQAMRFKSPAGGLIRDHKATVQPGIIAAANGMRELQPSAVVRHRGFVFSGVDAMHLCRPVAHRSGPLAVFAPAYCDRGASFNVSEP